MGSHCVFLEGQLDKYCGFEKTTKHAIVPTLFWELDRYRRFKKTTEHKKKPGYFLRTSRTSQRKTQFLRTR
jgi:hypothetical protein